MSGRGNFTKAAQTVTAGAAEKNAEALGTHGALKDAVYVSGVNGDKAVKSMVALPKELAATQVTVSFFAYGADDIKVATEFNAAFFD